MFGLFDGFRDFLAGGFDDLLVLGFVAEYVAAWLGGCEDLGRSGGSSAGLSYEVLQVAFFVRCASVGEGCCSRGERRFGEVGVFGVGCGECVAAEMNPVQPFASNGRSPYSPAKVPTLPPLGALTSSLRPLPSVRKARKPPPRPDNRHSDNAGDLQLSPRSEAGRDDVEYRTGGEDAEV